MQAVGSVIHTPNLNFDWVAGAHVQALQLKAPVHVQACLRARFGGASLLAREDLRSARPLLSRWDAISWRACGLRPAPRLEDLAWDHSAGTNQGSGLLAPMSRPLVG